MAERIRIGTATDIPEGYSKCFDIEDLRIAVFNVGGTYYAIDDACPHAGASLSDSIPEEGKVCCQWHGASFYLHNGKCTIEGIFPDVGHYPVLIENNEMFLVIPKSLTG